jgi:hypothetical protein
MPRGWGTYLILICDEIRIWPSRRPFFSRRPSLDFSSYFLNILSFYLYSRALPVWILEWVEIQFFYLKVLKPFLLNIILLRLLPTYFHYASTKKNYFEIYTGLLLHGGTIIYIGNNNRKKQLHVINPLERPNLSAAQVFFCWKPQVSLHSLSLFYSMLSDDHEATKIASA